MKCPNCNHPNPDSAKFCSQCGLTLTKDSKTVFCSQCGEENKKFNQYCVVCGAKLIRVEQKRKKADSAARKKKSGVDKKKVQQKGNFWTFNGILAASVLIVIASLFIIKVMHSDNRPRRVNIPVNNEFDLVLEAQVISVASKFVCSCGGCGEESLDTCACDTAVNEKQFIRQVLKAGKSERETILAVNQKFGSLKSEYENEYGNI